MPCSKYKGAQQRLCYATDEWKNWDKIIMNKSTTKKAKIKTGEIKFEGGKK